MFRNAKSPFPKTSAHKYGYLENVPAGDLMRWIFFFTSLMAWSSRSSLPFFSLKVERCIRRILRNVQDKWIPGKRVILILTCTKSKVCAYRFSMNWFCLLTLISSTLFIACTTKKKSGINTRTRFQENEMKVLVEKVKRWTALTENRSISFVHARAKAFCSANLIWLACSVPQLSFIFHWNMSPFLELEDWIHGQFFACCFPERLSPLHFSRISLLLESLVAFWPTKPKDLKKAGKKSGSHTFQKGAGRTAAAPHEERAQMRIRVFCFEHSTQSRGWCRRESPTHNVFGIVCWWFTSTETVCCVPVGNYCVIGEQRTTGDWRIRGTAEDLIHLLLSIGYLL